MNTFYSILATILGILFIAVIHEAGHYIAARVFGLRVSKVSLGLGPAIWKYKPKDSETTYQIALIPVLAYVLIDGTDEYPEDQETFKNASLPIRMLVVTAGPFASYLDSVALFFAALALSSFDLGPAVWAAVQLPARLIGATLLQLLSGTAEVGIAGPIGIGKILSAALQKSGIDFLMTLGALNAGMVLFNLLPLPALDGGRLAFLSYEAVTRRRVNPTVEGLINIAGFVLILAIVCATSYADWKR